MFAQKKTSSDIRYLDVLVPRGLVTSGRNLLNAPVTSEGLCSLRMFLGDGSIRGFDKISYSSEKCFGLLLPRLVEPHAHIDKAFSWKDFPNLSGTYEGAMKANLEEHKNRNKSKVRSRAEKLLGLGLKNGIRAVRSHVDSFGLVGGQTWDVLLEIKSEWEQKIELQLVSMVPLEYWISNEGETLAKRVSKEGGLLGGVIGPPYKKKLLRESLLNVFSLANDLGCGIDFHIDESHLDPGGGLRELLYVLDRISMDVPITCSHISSMSLLSHKNLCFFAERLAHYNVKVVALPLTNFWLLSRHYMATPVKRPLAPINQLQKAGVTVGIGGDNVQDPWNPIGDFDPLSLIAASIPMAQVAPWQREGLATFTTGAARIMDLEWDGSFQVGSPADFILLDADSWTSALSMSPDRKVMINGAWAE